MCIKSKTSFGCGHWIKVTEPCDSRTCTTVDKWSFPACKDCPQCKSAGVAINRGREGRGPHAREIKNRDQRRPSPNTSTAPSSPSGPAHLSISPWASNERTLSEKKWDTPTRQKADAAWLVEHERRISDIEDRTTKISIRSRRDSNGSPPRNSYEKVIEADEVEEPEELDYVSTHSHVRKLLPYEVSHSSSASPSRRRSPKQGHGSEHDLSQSRELVLSTPRRRTQYDSSRSEYPEEPAYHQIIRKSRKTRTEPYYAQSCSFDPPVQIMTSSSPIPGENWGNVYEYVQPSHHDACYPRAYPVY